MLDYTAALPTLREVRPDPVKGLALVRAHLEIVRKMFAQGDCDAKRLRDAELAVEGRERLMEIRRKSRPTLNERRAVAQRAQRARRLAKRAADRLLGRKRKRTPQAAPRAASRQRRSRTAASPSRDSGSSGSDSDPPPPRRQLYSVPEAADEAGLPERTLSTMLGRGWADRRRNNFVSVPYRQAVGGKRFLTPETVEALCRLIDHAAGRRITATMAAGFLR